MAKEKFNISFKKHPRETGLAAIGHPYQSVDIKLNKQCIGMIDAPNWQKAQWRIRITIKDSEQFCGWRWIQFKTKFDTEEEAREWVKTNLKAISEEYELHVFED